MNTHHKHRLQPGTLLDDRYLIEKVLGEGGFGITYAGINQRIHLKVAIKEFYWRDYVARNIENSPEIHIISEENREMIEKAKEKFLKEARIISDFTDEKSIVNVNDYFEANNTAYIVMSYLDGITLKTYLKGKGPFDSETIFRKMLPLMEGLGKVHACGIIHRDISPDNIMMVPDGNLKLLDFGAARDYSGVMDKSYSVIVKGGYAPIEQYNRSSVQGPWTDIYALSATLYECITGIMPDDALQRVFHDELKKPSELDIKIDKELEKILWKGLNVSPEERYSSVDAMLEDIRHILKDEIPGKEKKRWHLPAMIGAAAISLLIALAGIYTYADNHIASFKFRGIQTETVVLSPAENMSAKEFREAQDIIKNRLENFAGKDNYLIKEDGNSNLTIITPLDVYHNWNISGAVKAFISRPGRLFFHNENDHLTEITPGDFIAIDKKYGTAAGIIPSDWNLPENKDYTYYELKLSDETTHTLLSLMEDSNKIVFYQDADIFLNTLSITGYYQESSGAFAFIEENENFVHTLAYNLDNEKFSQPFSVYTEIPATWENASQSIIAGINQVNAENIPDPALHIQYSGSFLNSTVSKGQWYNVIADIKTRMDTLEIPYAFGICHDNEYNFVLKIPLDKASLEPLYLLGYNYASIKDLRNGYYPYIDDISVNTSGKSVDISFASYNDTSDLTSKTAALIEQKQPSLYLDIMGCKLFKYDFSEPLTENQISFTQWNRRENKTFTEEDMSLLHFFKTLTADTELPITYQMANYSATTAQGNIDTTYSINDHSVLGLNTESDMTRHIRDLFPECEINESYNYGGPVLDVAFDMDLNSASLKQLLDNFQELYEDESSGFSEGFYHYINFYWSENTANNTISIHAYHNTSDSRTELYGNFQGTLLEPYMEDLSDYLTQSEFYRENSYDRIWYIGNSEFSYIPQNTKEADTQ